jgi:hypothetical protein
VLTIPTLAAAAGVALKGLIYAGKDAAGPTAPAEQAAVALAG